jgi:RNA polymerase sigma factor (sigma-70 family)
VEELLRALAPQVLGILARRWGDFADAEDAVQEALIAAAVEWPVRGLPGEPRGWLIRVAERRLMDAWRSTSARRRREAVDARLAGDQDRAGPGPLTRDDSLELLLLCCHPALTRPSQVALTLRAVGGLTTGEIAKAYLVPETTIAQRISRAKAAIKAAGARFERPCATALPARIAAVAEVLYLVFTEGHTASSGGDLVRLDLTAEAIRLARLLRAGVAADPALAGLRGEASGLLALMLLTDARRPARLDAAGELVPLGEQDRASWDAAMIAEGVALVSAALSREVIGPYQLQAAIAAVHDEAGSVADTDWREILALYDLLAVLGPGPMVSLNRVVALAMVEGPEVGLLALEVTAVDPALAGHHRVHAVRAQLLERSGEPELAGREYREAARLTRSLPERRYLDRRAARLGPRGGG